MGKFLKNKPENGNAKKEENMFLKYFIAPAVVALILLVAQFILHPLLEKKIIMKKELWLEKKEVYWESIYLIDKSYDSLALSKEGYPGHIPTKNKPNTQEINEVYRKLFLLSENEDIPVIFIRFFDKDSKFSAALRGEYIKLLRKDLDGFKIRTDSEKIPFFYNTEQLGE
ncbi:hypothetical protein KAS42_02385 [bacterium]|nr:hypothetical protein [bacterium]